MFSLLSISLSSFLSCAPALHKHQELVGRKEKHYIESKSEERNTQAEKSYRSARERSVRNTTAKTAEYRDRVCDFFIQLRSSSPTRSKNLAFIIYARAKSYFRRQERFFVFVVHFTSRSFTHQVVSRELTCTDADTSVGRAGRESIIIPEKKSTQVEDDDSVRARWQCDFLHFCGVPVVSSFALGSGRCCFMLRIIIISWLNTHIMKSDKWSEAKTNAASESWRVFIARVIGSWEEK